MESWMNQTWWLYDLTVLAIIVFCIWGGWRRGIWRTITSLLGYILAAFLSSILVEPIAEVVYDRWLASYCIEYLNDQIETYNLPQTLQSVFDNYGIHLDQNQLQKLTEESGSTVDQLCMATGLSENALENGLLQSLNSSTLAGYTGLPTWMTQALLPSESIRENSDRLIETAAVILSGDSEKASEQLTENYIRPVVISFVKFILFFLLFLLISAIIQVIIKGISYLLRSNRLLYLNQILGAAVGCLQAILFLLLMKTLTNWLVDGGADHLAFFNEAMIKKTILFQYIYYLS